MSRAAARNPKSLLPSLSPLSLLTSAMNASSVPAILSPSAFMEAVTGASFSSTAGSTTSFPVAFSLFMRSTPDCFRASFLAA